VGVFSLEKLNHLSRSLAQFVNADRQILNFSETAATFSPASIRKTARK
jgi:hypothetical protein